MLRKELLEKVELVSPALMVNDLIPILTHVWFTGTHLIAFNDQIGLSVPFKSDFKGAIPGALLRSLLSKSRAKEVEFEVIDDSKLRLHLASSRLTLPMLPPDSFSFFKMPKGTDKGTPAKPIATLLASCLRSVSSDPMVADQLGISLIRANDAETMFCSTNEATLTFVKTKSTAADFGKRVVLSAQFCRQLVTLTARGLKGMRCEVSKEYSLLTSDEGISCFGHLILVEHPFDFQETIRVHAPKSLSNSTYPIPSKMHLVIERAIAVASSATSERVLTKITVKNGNMRFVTQSSLGEMVDTVQVAESQPDASIKLDPRFLKTGFADFYDEDKDSCGSMLLTNGAFVMMRGQDHYLIAASAGD